MRPLTPLEQFALEMKFGVAVLKPSSTTRSLLDAFLNVAKTTAKTTGSTTKDNNAGEHHHKSETMVKTKTRVLTSSATRKLPPLTPAQMSDHKFILHRAKMIAAKKLRLKREKQKEKEREKEPQQQKKVS
ncbi:hypothetical protein EDC01DRAFT_635226 [Geopyxis carbonaria]|nr:hypothetical protein EDC01DRAFT_635226 [Geopyxis carbonaria]